MNELEKIHKDIFGIAPVIIGLHWDEIEQRLIDAIESGIPYNEEKELTTEELIEFRAGKISF
jgi:DNA repair photolyase